jgi:hypothetical protein
MEAAGTHPDAQSPKSNPSAGRLKQIPFELAQVLAFQAERLIPISVCRGGRDWHIQMQCTQCGFLTALERPHARNST